MKTVRHFFVTTDMSLQLHQAGSVEWWDLWTDTMQRVPRLEALICHSRILLHNGYVDRQDEVSSARRVYREIVGPTRSVDWCDLVKRCDRGGASGKRSLRELRLP